ncbi:MAG: glycoside hydrolase family 2 protein [Solirubrobacteraceae bacterium]
MAFTALPSDAAAADVRAATNQAPAALGGPFGRTAITGPWVVADDPRNRGVSRGWHRKPFPGKSVDLPYVPNASRITGATGVISHRGSVAWYRTTITVPQDGVYALGFGSVNHKATVWLDGRVVARHTGEFLPFEVRRSLKAGREYSIVVRADWRDPEKMKAQGWHRLWFNYGGINREVTLRRLGPSDIRSPYVTTELQGDGSAKVTISAEVVNRGRARELQLVGLLRRDGQDLPVGFPPVRLGVASSKRVETTVTVPSPALWAPGSPNLYDLTLTVAGESAHQSRVGLREVTKRGNHMFLNGKRVTLRGASIHEDARGIGTGLRPSDMDELISDLQKIGANATRAQHPLDPALMERLDAAGIMIWQGIGPTDSPGSWKSDTPAKAKVAKNRVQTSLDQLQTHPSIVVWNLVNEISKNGNSGGQVPFIREMSRKLKREDPGKLVALDIWGTPRKLCRSNKGDMVTIDVWRGRKNAPCGANGSRRYYWDTRLPDKLGPVYQYIDAIGLTNYEGWYSEPGASMSYIRRRLHAYMEAAKKAYPDRVLAVTEVGAEANGENSANKPGGYGYQSKLLKTTIDTYARDSGVSGTIVWNLRDFGVAPTFLGGSIRNVYSGPMRLVRGLNQKGLFTYGGRAKPSVAVVRDALARAAKTQGVE